MTKPKRGPQTEPVASEQSAKGQAAKGTTSQPEARRAAVPSDPASLEKEKSKRAKAEAEAKFQNYLRFKVREEIKERGWGGLSVIAGICGVSPGHVNRFLRKKKGFGFSVATNLAAYWGTTVDELYKQSQLRVTDPGQTPEDDPFPGRAAIRRDPRWNNISKVAQQAILNIHSPQIDAAWQMLLWAMETAFPAEVLPLPVDERGQLPPAGVAGGAAADDLDSTSEDDEEEGDGAEDEEDEDPQGGFFHREEPKIPAVNGPKRAPRRRLGAAIRVA